MTVKREKWSALHKILNMTHGMTARQLYDSINQKKHGKICYNTIYNWKAGRVFHPKMDTMQVVLNALGYRFAIVQSAVIVQPEAKPAVEVKQVKQKKQTKKRRPVKKPVIKEPTHTVDIPLQ